MKKIVLPVIVVCSLVFGISCTKKTTCVTPTTKAPQLEIDSLQHFLDSTGVVAVKDSRGFFYSIADSGTNEKPNECSYVYVDYIGKLTNGNVFDRPTYITGFLLKSVIAGWQESLPLIGKGGRMTIYIPPTLGYGTTAKSTIPANSILIFDINLVNF